VIARPRRRVPVTNPACPLHRVRGGSIVISEASRRTRRNRPRARDRSQAGMPHDAGARARPGAARITVNCVVPGTIETVRGCRARASPERPARLPHRPPLRTGEVAAVGAMLCGPDARYIRSDHSRKRAGFMP